MLENALLRHQLIVLGELGFISFSTTDAQLIFQLCGLLLHGQYFPTPLDFFPARHYYTYDVRIYLQGGAKCKRN